MSRMKTRGVTLAVAAPNGDVTSRGWQITYGQEQQILELLGPPDLETIIVAEKLAEMREQFDFLPSLEPSRDLEAERLDAHVASGMRSLVGVVTPGGDVQMMIIHGPAPQHDETRAVAMIPNAMVVIKSEEFERWLDGMKDWWKANK